MRIAIVNWSRRRVGGVERYLHEVVPALAAEGHELGFWYEMDRPIDREPIWMPEDAPAWCVEELGLERAVEELRAWRPDLVFKHILNDPETEAAVLPVAPAVFFAHAYYGTCISGEKTHKRPVPTPCGRRLGPGCLLHYYPHRCGGLSPLTMIRDYGRQTRRRELLQRYRAIIANSSHLQAEYAAHVRDPARVYAVPLPVTPGVPPSAWEDGAAREEWRLLFLGRMDVLKGGGTLLEALPRAAAALGTRLRVTFAGDGPERAEWERRAAGVQARTPGLAIEFPGWVDESELEEVWKRTDLLVVPSLWPEPFGLVGPEAGTRGVPAAAFANGGIPDWLEEGVNGALAPVDPPTAGGLADAIVRCLRDPAHHARLRRGAVEAARRFDPAAHVRALTEIFARVLREEEAPA